MRTVLAATSVFALSLALPVSAQMADMVYNPTGDELSGAALIGTSVYTSEDDVADDSVWADWDGSPDGWDSVGEVTDVLLSRDGSVEAVLVDVGGFLGLGEKTVAVDMDALRIGGADQTGDDITVVFTSDRAALENAPEYTGADRAGLDTGETNLAERPEETGIEGSGAGYDAAAGSMADPQMMSEQDTDTAQAETAPMAEDMAADAPNSVMTDDDSQQGWVSAAATDIRVETLTGARVYDAEDRHIGEVSELVMSGDGQIDATVIDVGGFLGLGEKPVELPFDALDIRKESADSDVLRVYLTHTRDELEDMPAYEG